MLAVIFLRLPLLTLSARLAETDPRTQPEAEEKGAFARDGLVAAFRGLHGKALDRALLVSRFCSRVPYCICCAALLFSHSDFGASCNRRVGYMANKPIKEKIARKKADKEFMSPGKDQQDDADNNDARQEQVDYEPGILDDIDFGPLDGNSSGNGGSFSFSDEQPERLRDGNSADGSIRASSKRSSRMSADSFEIPNR
jgi:hypothetical protein